MIVTREDVRLKLVARIQALKATWAGYPLEIEYDNLAAVNLSVQTNPYLCVRMVYMDGYQTTLSANPGNRVLGTIVLEVKVKQGSGTAKANALLEHFYRSVHMTDSMDPLRTFAARFGSAPPKDGWVAQAALIPFWYDSMP